VSTFRVANKKRICYLALMQVRSCHVTIRDIDGHTHCVEVTAATLFEAVAQATARPYDETTGCRIFPERRML
jgi:hypothetical protein